MDKRIQINVRVNTDLSKRFKKACIDAGVTMTALLVLFVKAFVEGRIVYAPNDEERLQCRGGKAQ